MIFGQNAKEENSIQFPHSMKLNEGYSAVLFRRVLDSFE